MFFSLFIDYIKDIIIEFFRKKSSLNTTKIVLHCLVNSHYITNYSLVFYLQISKQPVLAQNIGNNDAAENICK